MWSPFCGHFTGCLSNVEWLTSWPFLRSTCDSRRHQRTWTVSSLIVSLPLECRSGRWLVLWWQSQGLTLCAQVALSACVLQSYGTVFRRIFNYVAVWKLLNQNWKHFYFIKPLTFDWSQSASASSDFMALYKWFYLHTYLQLSEIADPTLLMPSNVTIMPADSAQNLGVIFDSTPSMSHHISSVSKSCFSSVRDLRRIGNINTLNLTQTIATSLIHSKLNYCNSLFLHLPRSQLSHLQLILNSTARAVSKTLKFSHITPVLKSLHWLKLNIWFNIKLSLTYKTLNPTNLPISMTCFTFSAQKHPLLILSLFNVLLFALV